MRSTSDLIPRRVLLGDPERLSPRISPDGRFLAYLAPSEGVLNIWTAPVDDLDGAVVVTRDRKRGVQTYGWAGTNDHLWFLQDEGGNENHHLYVVPRDGGPAVDLTPFERTQTRIVGSSPTRPGEVLIAINNRDPRWHDVHLLDLATGELQLVVKNEEFSQFYCDADLRPRLALRNTADGGRDVLTNFDRGWSELFHISAEDVITTQPVGLGPVGERWAYFLDSRDRDKAAAVFVDLTDGKTSLLAEDLDTDVLALEIHPRTRQVEAYRTDYLRPAWTTVDVAVADDYRRLGDELGDFKLISRSDDDGLWILQSSSDRSPGRFHLYRRREGRLELLFSARPELETWTLTPMEATVIPARDGLKLVSYLTTPTATQGPHPMVLLVHGGPWSRDHFGYNAEHQFWANRGYAVLSVNFRGSTGFGKAFVNAGDREWGGRMQDDLLDAVQWAIREGVADRDRIAIMGGSYGGYATLAGLAFTPEVFACGVDLVGPSNLETLLGSIPPYWASIFETFALRTGDPRTAEGRLLLYERSPLHHCRDIRRPLLIAQGANDVRVTQAEADQIVQAMTENDQPVTYLLYPDEGHGFGRAVNRVSFMAVAEVFLAGILGGKHESFGPDTKGTSLQVPCGIENIPGLKTALESPGD